VSKTVNLMEKVLDIKCVFYFLKHVSPLHGLNRLFWPVSFRCMIGGLHATKARVTLEMCAKTPNRMSVVVVLDRF
jgi:hypothetical protein